MRIDDYARWLGRVRLTVAIAMVGCGPPPSLSPSDSALDVHLEWFRMEAPGVLVGRLLFSPVLYWSDVSCALQQTFDAPLTARVR